MVPGAARTDAGTERRWLPPVLPPRPARSEGTGENAEQVREIEIIETYGLTVASALAEGDARRNMARTITDARYTVYSNNTTALRLEFRDGSPYVYHFSRPHGSIEIRTGVFRETCGVTVQVGKMLLLETYTAEIYRDERGIMQTDILGNGRIIVRFDVARKP